MVTRMQIRCPQCGHLGADATRAGTALDLRCTACDHTWRTTQTFDEIRYSTDPPRDAKPVTRSATRHDYRVQGFGHAFAGFTRNGDVRGDAPIYGGCVFGANIQIGDELLVNQQSGRTAVYVVLTTRRPLDPGDQYFITAYPDHYLDEETPTVEDHPPAGTRMRNPHTGSVFVRVDGGYLAEQLGTEPVHGKQGSYLYRDGEGRTGPLHPVTSTTTEGTE